MGQKDLGSKNFQKFSNQEIFHIVYIFISGFWPFSSFNSVRLGNICSLSGDVEVQVAPQLRSEEDHEGGQQVTVPPVLQGQKCSR